MKTTDRGRTDGVDGQSTEPTEKKENKQYLKMPNTEDDRRRNDKFKGWIRCAYACVFV